MCVSWKGVFSPIFGIKTLVEIYMFIFKGKSLQAAKIKDFFESLGDL